jgi:type IV pilus assembly protein PilP
MKNANMIQLTKIAVVFFLIGALSGFSGCSSSDSPQQKPEIVRNKISEKPEAVVPAPLPGTTASLAPDASSKKHPGAAGQSGETPKQSPEEGQKPSIADSATASVSYIPAGKIDPFVPLLKEEPVKALPSEKSKMEKREPTTPLERIDLSQLKLTAIIQTRSGLKAMVEETTGKGYIVGVGTYMGIHSGKVVNILKDRVVVEEEVEDALGNVVSRNSELKFQKPSGEL